MDQEHEGTRSPLGSRSSEPPPHLRARQVPDTASDAFAIRGQTLLCCSTERLARRRASAMKLHGALPEAGCGLQTAEF